MKLSHEAESFHTFCFSSVSLHLHIIAFLFSLSCPYLPFAYRTERKFKGKKIAMRQKKQTKKDLAVFFQTTLGRATALYRPFS